MKISYNWLKNYVAIKIKPEVLAHKLTMAGLEVEKIETVGDDAVFELEITPNRPDCLNFLGFAREVSAILNTPLKTPKIKKVKYPPTKPSIKIDDKKGCLRYIGTLIEDVCVEESPIALKEKLASVGLRPVNNIVDLTNFCLMETGQPMHAFDYDKLEGGKIIVRRAREGESIIAIDGDKRTLDPSVLVIADEFRPVAIAGIMGGLATEVTEKTKNILLESAYFDPILIRRGARKVGLSSDSSYRFERGVDMKGVETGSRRAVSLILEYSGGKISKHTDAYPKKQKETIKTITVSLPRVNDFLGARIPAARCKMILTRLGFQVRAPKKDTLQVIPPSFRGDVSLEVDVAEEIARIVGYDNLPVRLPSIKYSDIRESHKRKLRTTMAEALRSQGLDEVISYAMTNSAALQKTKITSEGSVSVQNPLTLDQELMRPALLPSLLGIVAGNINKGQKDLGLFETGKTYPPSGEKEATAILLTGTRRKDWREFKKETVDFFDMKGVVEHLLRQMNIKEARFVPEENPSFEQGQCATLLVNNKPMGILGRLSAEVVTNWDIKDREIYFAQLDSEALYAQARPKGQYKALSNYPSVQRDISLAVKDKVTFEQLKKVASTLGYGLLRSVEFIEEYRGEKIPKGLRGVTISLTYQSSTRTLREEEVDAVHDKICKHIEEDLEAIKR